MTDQSEKINKTSELNTQLETTVKEVGQLQTTLDRMLQALNSRGIQVMIDFNEMLEQIRSRLDTSQKHSRKLTQSFEQFQELVRTSALLTSSLDLDDVLQGVMDTVVALTGAERAYLMLKPPDSEELRIQAARNWDRETLEKDEITFSQGIMQTAIKGRAPLVTTNAQDDDRFKEMASVISHNLRSIIVVPLILQDNVIGVLYADNRIEQGVFTQENVPLLTAFANQAAIAISNARLFEKVKEDLREAQREVQRLRIEIDQSRVEEKVTEITESDYFQYLTAKARDLRQRNVDREKDEE